MVKGKIFVPTSIKQQVIERSGENVQQQEIENLGSTSSSSSETESTESFTLVHESVEEKELSDIFDNLSIFDTDNDCLEENDPEYVKHETLEVVPNFLNTFCEVPDVDDISEDIVVPLQTHTLADIQIDHLSDKGKFVDPLLGIEINSKEVSKESITEDIESKDTSETEEDEQSLEVEELVEDIEFFLPDDKYTTDEKVHKISVSEEALETIFELEVQQVVEDFDDIDYEFKAKEEENKQIYSNTQDFINDLINRVVDIAEYVSPEIVLRQNLDKRKLIEEILDKHPTYNIELSVNQFFNRKIVEYYRRKKSFRPIMQDNAKTLTQDKEKFKNAIDRLDLLLAKEAKLKSSTFKIIEELKTEYEKTKEMAESEVQLLESIVKKNLFRDNRSKVNVIIEHLLTRMNKYRKEVNEVRFKMFYKQHSEAHLIALLAKLEDLGNGLSMRDFVALQAETQTLDKKIEERNAELNKLHFRCHSDIHTMAHYKEKQKMLRDSIAIQRSVFESLIDEKDLLRERLHYLKLNRNRVRKQIKDSSIQGGLLDKPALMLDYDETVRMLREKRETVDFLKNNLLDIQQTIDKISKHCAVL